MDLFLIIHLTLKTTDDKDFNNSAPATWDPKALQRVHFPAKNASNGSVKDIIAAANPPAPAKLVYKQEHFSQKPTDQCYKDEYPLETADDLLATLTEETENIIVTVWYENIQGKWAQNMLNQNVLGTLWRCLCQNHPDVIYAEADLSHYNRYAYTYENLAKKLEISIDSLYGGPTIAIMRDQTGMTFRTNSEPEKLLSVVEEYLRTWEKDLFGVENPKCDLRDQSLSDNHFDAYMPYGNLDMYNPSGDETNHAVKEAKQVEPHVSSPSLAEPSKAFT